jgi:single-strand DNA-binding protein
LAINSAGSINKGDRVLVVGKLRVRDWDNGERAGTSVEIEAEAVGHDLSWGSSSFTRTVLVRETDPSEEVVTSSDDRDFDDDFEDDDDGEKELVGAGAK